MLIENLMHFERRSSDFINGVE